MAITWKQFCEAVLAAAPAVVGYTAASATTGSIQAASAWNPAGAAGNVTVDVWIVPAGGTPTDANHVDRITLPPGVPGMLANLINQKVPAGASIYASGLGATLTISGAEQT